MSADSFVSAQGNGREEYNKEHKPEYEKLKKEREEKDSDEMIEQCITVSPSSMTVATCVYHCSPSAAPLQHGHVPVQPPLQPGLLTLLHQTAVVPHHHRCSALPLLSHSSHNAVGPEGRGGASPGCLLAVWLPPGLHLSL